MKSRELKGLARRRWEQEIQSRVDAGQSRREAVRLLAKADPKLRERMVAEANRKASR